MIYFANPSTQPVRDAMATGLLGAIITPAQGNRLPPGALFVIDNGCGPGKNGKPGENYPGDEVYVAMLQHVGQGDGYEDCDPDTSWCLFAVAPDVVGDAAATLKRSRHMLGWIRYAGFRAALAAQNGLTPDMVPWDDFDALFLGGSPECIPCGYVSPVSLRKQPRCPLCARPLAEWKLSAAAQLLTGEAKAGGKHVHMGRVNSQVRIEHAAATGCDTADGTFVAQGPDKNLPIALGWGRKVNDQGVLWRAA